MMLVVEPLGSCLSCQVMRQYGKFHDSIIAPSDYWDNILKGNLENMLHPKKAQPKNAA